MEKGIEKGFEGAEEGATEVNALKEMERAKVEVQEREEKKALTMGAGDAPAAPNMKIKVCGMVLDAWDVILINMFVYRERHLVAGRKPGISFRLSSQMHTRIGRLWRSRLRWHVAIGRKLAISMVSGIRPCFLCLFT